MAKKSSQASFSVKSKKKDKKRPGPPAKLPNLEKRSRECLTVSEVNKLIKTAKTLGRHGELDSLMILVMYRHALRVGELLDLHWDQIDLNRGRMHVNRLKNSDPSVHYLEGDEIRALRKLRREYPATGFVFESKRLAPLTPNAVHKMTARAGIEAQLELSVHPPHASSREGLSARFRRRRYEGYTSLHGAQKHSAYGSLYTQLNPKRFKGFGKDIRL